MANPLGKQVKTFSHHIPQPDGTSEQVRVKVHLAAADGVFGIPWPEHINDVLPALDGDYQSDACTNKVMDSCIDKWKAGLRAYEKWLKDTQSTKVLVIEFKKNIRHIDGFHNAPGRNRTDFVGYGAFQGDISFTRHPAMCLWFEVLHQIGDDYYRRRQGRYQFCRPDSKSIIIPWTQEREDFLDNATESFETLICRLMEFFEDAEGNIERALAGQLNPMLPAPPEGDDAR